MFGTRLIDSSYKLVNERNLKLNVETTSEHTHISNSDVEQVSSKSKISKQNTLYKKMKFSIKDFFSKCDQPNPQLN